ncbi:regulatory protein GemA [Roseobacter sp. YSTF-M11]|uniref:Regulatory protein GemA n=2 Tax=Roseobacter insulae TaxID=2859783 RepID=A0A9X1FVY3_9RHOB|nr:regulatory protein GemA [Roseobacter insulae]
MKLIHVACRELALDQDDRRALQLEVCGKASMSEMTEQDMDAVLDRLKKDGFNPNSKPGKTHRAAPRSDLRLIHVLWRKLGDAGVLDRPDRAGLNAFVRSRFGDHWQSVPADIDMLREKDQIDAVIRALKAWGKRAGIDFDFGRTGR